MTLPAHKLRRGDVATIVEAHPGRPGQEAGYSLDYQPCAGSGVALALAVA
jgi:hypothetical protein